MRKALDALRRAEPLRDHPLTSFNIVLSKLHIPFKLAGPLELDQAVYDLLIRQITDELDRLRQLEGLAPSSKVPQTRAASEDALRLDFQQGNCELEAWSLLYHRFVRVDLDLQMQDIARLTAQDLRTLRRRLRRGVARLGTRLTEAEKESRLRDARLRMLASLPAPRHDLLGADEYINAVIDTLTSGGPPNVVALIGAGGLGKTAILLEAAYRLIEQGVPEDLIWLEVGHDEADTLIGRLTESLPIPDVAEQEERRMALRAYLLQYRVLIVLDNAERLVQDVDGLREISATLAGAKAAIASRVAPPAGLGIRVIEVRELERRLAWKLLERDAKWGGRKYPGPEEFEAVLDVAGGNPLALQLAARSLRHLAASHTAARLGAMRTPSGRTLFDELYGVAWESMSRRARELWALHLLFPQAGAPFEWLAYVVGWGEGKLAEALDDLYSRSLLAIGEEDASTRECRSTLHRLARGYLEGKARSDRALSKMLTDGANAVAGHLVGRATDGDLEYGIHLLTKIPVRLEREVETALIRACHGITTRTGKWYTWAAALRMLDDEGREAGFYAILGEAERRAGRAERASEALNKAVEMAGAAGDFLTQAYALIQRAALTRMSGNPEGAMADAERAYRTLGRLGDLEGERAALAEMAQCELDAHRPDKALALLEDYADCDDVRLVSRRSMALLELGFVEKALNEAKRALKLARDEGNQLHVARAMANLARVRLEAGDLEGAEAGFESAMAKMDALRDSLGLARTRHNLGAVYLARGMYRRAIETLESALRDMEAVGDAAGASACKAALIEAHLMAAHHAESQGHSSAAKRHYSALRELGAEYSTGEER